MYVPPAFRIEDLAEIQAAIRSARLAQVVTLGAGGLAATPLPLLLDPDEGAFGTLYGHVARANPQWREAAPGGEALAIFMGPDAYVTPAWYEAKAETGKVVPTWNYVTIHAYGRLRFIEDADELLGIVTRLTDTHEKPRAAPWAVSDAPTDFVRAQLKGIVGVEMTVTKLQGKWKMSQNRNAPDRQGVAEGLAEDGEAAVASLIPVDAK
jgi:transcriptional regulator